MNQEQYTEESTQRQTKTHDHEAGFVRSDMNDLKTSN